METNWLSNDGHNPPILSIHSSTAIFALEKSRITREIHKYIGNNVLDDAGGGLTEEDVAFN